MRYFSNILGVMALATLIQGCSSHKPWGVPVSEGERHQICERIEYQLHFGEARNNQNMARTTTEHANLWHQYRHYGCPKIMADS